MKMFVAKRAFGISFLKQAITLFPLQREGTTAKGTKGFLDFIEEINVEAPITN